MAALGCTPEEHNSRWARHWGKEGGLQPGEMWDIQGSAKSLKELLASGELAVEGKRAFVPGCGRGYDAVTLAEAGAKHVNGLDISAHGVIAAKAHVASQPPDIVARIEIMEGDFFQFCKRSVREESFDVGYDYTFFCALLPSMRPDWAQAWSKVLKPGGLLVTLQYPMSSDPPSEGPPFAVSDEAYTSALTPAGFQNVYREQVPASLSHEPRAGKEVMSIWKKLP